MARHQYIISTIFVATIIVPSTHAARIFTTSQGSRAQQYLGSDIRNPGRYGFQWLHGFTPNDHLDIVAYGEVLPDAAATPTINLSVVLRNYSHCWHYRVDEAIPAGWWSSCTVVSHAGAHTYTIHLGARMLDAWGRPWLSKQALSIEVSTPDLTRCDVLCMCGL